MPIYISLPTPFLLLDLDLEAITPHASFMSLQQVLTFHLGLFRCRSEETIIPLGFGLRASTASIAQL